MDCGQIEEREVDKRMLLEDVLQTPWPIFSTHCSSKHVHRNLVPPALAPAPAPAARGAAHTGIFWPVWGRRRPGSS